MKFETSQRETLRPLNSAVHGSPRPLRTHLMCLALSGFSLTNCSLVCIPLTFSYCYTSAKLFPELICSQRHFLLGFILNKYKKGLYYLQIKSISCVCPSNEIWLHFRQQIISNEIEAEGAVLLIPARLKTLLNEKFLLQLIKLYLGKDRGKHSVFCVMHPQCSPKLSLKTRAKQALNFP